MSNHPNSPVIAMLKDAKAKAVAVIKAKKAEIADIDRAIAAVSNASDAAMRTNIFSDVSQIRHSVPVGDAIVAAVEAGEKSPSDILRYLQDVLGVPTTIGSVRARLSPLKAAGKISHDGKGWIPVTKEKSENDGFLDNLS